MKTSLSVMSPRERILAALRGQEVDRLPWCPFLAYWWEAQPAEFQQRGQLAFLREIGADALLRGFVTPYKVLESPTVEVRSEKKNGRTYTETITPVGTLRAAWQYSPAGNTEFIIEHPVKCAEDFKIVRYTVEQMRLQPDDEPVKQWIADIGEDGLLAALIPPFGKTPFQSLVEHYVGTQQLAYFLADCPQEVEACLEVMNEKSLEAVRLAVESPAEAFITWEDSSTTNVSPAQFRRYIAAELNRWGEVVHDAGKLLLHHACGHVRHLLPIMAQETVDVIESLSPPPTGNVEIWEAQEVLGERVGVVGGIEPTQFLNLELDALSDYVEELLSRANPRHYILANSDSCPPGVSIEKFRRVTDIVRSHLV